MIDNKNKTKTYKYYVCLESIIDDKIIVNNIFMTIKDIQIINGRILYNSKLFNSMEEAIEYKETHVVDFNNAVQKILDHKFLSDEQIKTLCDKNILRCAEYYFNIKILGDIYGQ